jgi:hypothetical protein
MSYSFIMIPPVESVFRAGPADDGSLDGTANHGNPGVAG